MDVKNTHSITKTKISVFGRQALDAERRRSQSLADKVLKTELEISWVAPLQLENVCNLTVLERERLAIVKPNGEIIVLFTVSYKQ